MKKYRTISVLGEGGFATVVKAENIETKEIVAIKKMKQKYSSWPECLKLREAQCLINLRSGNNCHKNCIQLKSIFREFNELHFVFEFMDGDLFKIISEKKKNGMGFSEEQIRDIMKQTLLGLNFIHSRGYFHRDMKPENLLTKTDGSGDVTIKISDFGQAREIRSRPPFSEYVSTRWYRAPEVLLHFESYSYPIDLFALGAMMAELYLLRPLFPGKSEIDQLIKLCSTLGTPSKEKWEEGHRKAKKTGFKFPDFKPIPLSQIIKDASPEAISLMKKLMEWNPKDRPTCQQALQHAFFQKSKDTNFISKLAIEDDDYNYKSSVGVNLSGRNNNGSRFLRNGSMSTSSSRTGSGEFNLSNRKNSKNCKGSGGSIISLGSNEGFKKRGRKNSVLGFPSSKTKLSGRSRESSGVKKIASKIGKKRISKDFGTNSPRMKRNLSNIVKKKKSIEKLKKKSKTIPTELSGNRGFLLKTPSKNRLNLRQRHNLYKDVNKKYGSSVGKNSPRAAVRRNSKLSSGRLRNISREKDFSYYNPTVRNKYSLGNELKDLNVISQFQNIL